MIELQTHLCCTEVAGPRGPRPGLVLDLRGDGLGRRVPLAFGVVLVLRRVLTVGLGEGHLEERRRGAAAGAPKAPAAAVSVVRQGSPSHASVSRRTPAPAALRSAVRSTAVRLPAPMFQDPLPARFPAPAVFCPPHHAPRPCSQLPSESDQFP